MASDDAGGHKMAEGIKSHHEEKIVIVGGGIGGLACALALHRVGLKAVVLEQSETLRAMGTTLTLWTNAFRVLDVLGIGDKFRSMYINILKYEVFDEYGKRLAALTLADCPGGPHEMRAVERKVLLEALAGQLPPGTIRFNSRVTSIKKAQNPQDCTRVELQDGTTYSAKVVVGFDGVNSVVASWMGLEKAKAVGEVGIRGMAVFRDGHNFEAKVHYSVGKGSRSAIVPVSSTKAYWFVLWSDWSEGCHDNTPEQLKKEALQLTRGWSPEIHSCINNTPPENFIKSTIRHRVNTRPSASQVVGGVTLGGDASHPMTPYIGQGGCTALEDAVVLAQKLHRAFGLDLDTEVPEVAENERIHEALLEYQRERHDRTYPITVRSHTAGAAMRSSWTLYCFYRNWYLIPKSLNTATFLDHTLFDVGKLPAPPAHPEHKEV